MSCDTGPGRKTLRRIFARVWHMWWGHFITGKYRGRWPRKCDVTVTGCGCVHMFCWCGREF